MFGWLFWLIVLTITLGSAGHALLTKRDPRSALGWIVLCLTVPLLGSLCYWLFGVNRIRSRARLWRARGRGLCPLEPTDCSWEDELPCRVSFLPDNLRTLLSLSDTVTRRPLVPGNRIEPLFNGEQAYPAMLGAIAAARHSILLSTYIFDTDRTGNEFLDALRAAAARGVDVRIMIDALGERYSSPPLRKLLRDNTLRFARFLPFSLSGWGFFVNLRNHRKLLIVDNCVGFTGGMNISDRHLAANSANPQRVIDLHFRLTGPIVGQMLEAFLEDWQFASGEPVKDLPPYPDPLANSEACCRGISAGPNEDFEKLAWIVVGALNSARQRVCIMTPYFIPDRALIAAIDAASLRGVKVEILLPGRNNLPFVDWATRAYLWELLEHGTHVYYQPPPFVHSKLLVVDGEYALIGSANLDPRSLRLNFEFNVEIFDRELAARLTSHFDSARDCSRQITMTDVQRWPLPTRLRDAVCKLFSPYL